MNMTTSFDELNISPELKKSIVALGFQNLTEIQAAVIPMLLKPQKTDMVALAQTGSGKTAAFGIPLAEKIDIQLNQVQALVLSPTRELAAQIQDTFAKLMRPIGIKSMTIYGGQSYVQQKSQLKGNPHIIIATPGRLVDMLNQKQINLKNLKVLVLDEADRMLSMGFEEDLKAILNATHSKAVDAEATSSSDRAACPTWLFSATMSFGIKRILDKYLDKPEVIELNKSNQGVSSTLDHRYFPVKTGNRDKALLRILGSLEGFYGIVFCQTKRDVADVEEMLIKNGVSCMSLHGDKLQRERERILKALKAEQFSVLIATDVAARGIDVKSLKQVVHYSLPREVESYIHRSGRTGRNGEKGLVITIIEPSDFGILNRLQKTARLEIKPFETLKGSQLLQNYIQGELTQLSTKMTEKGDYQALLKICTQTVEAMSLQDLKASELLAAMMTKMSKNLDQYSDSFIMTDFSTKAQPRKEFSRGGGGFSRGRSSSFGSRDRDRDYDRGSSSSDRDNDRGRGSRGRSDERSTTSTDRRPTERPSAPRRRMVSADSRPAPTASGASASRSSTQRPQRRNNDRIAIANK